MFFNINRTVLISVAAGIVVGALGYKLYDKNKQCIDAKLKSLGVTSSGCDDGKCDLTSEASTAGLSVEELEAQKERLEDLIAELQQSQAQKNNEAK